MKKNYLFLLLSALMVLMQSCSKESDQINTAANGCRVSFAVSDDGSRVDYGDGENTTTVNWQQGDVIYIATTDGTWGSGYVNESDKPKEFTYNASTNLFEGDATLTAGKEYTFKAQYCAADQRTYLLSNNNSSNKLLAEQSQTGNSRSGMSAYDYMAASTTATVGATTVPTFAMRHLYSFVNIKVKNSTSAPVTLTSASLEAANAKLAGVFYYDLTTMAITSSVAKYDTDRITLTLTDATVEAGGTFDAYMVVAPISNWDGTLAVSLTWDGNTYSSVKDVTALTFERAKMNTTTFEINDTLNPDEGDDDPTVEQTASLTYAEAADKVTGYANENTYGNDYGSWTICAYNYDKRAFQLNAGKVAYLGTPLFDGAITKLKITTSNSFTGSYYICASANTGSASYKDLLLTAKGNGTETSIDLTTLAQSSKQIYIRTSAVCYITALDVTYGGTGDTTPADPTVPSFSEIKVSTTATSDADTSDGTAKLTSTLTYSGTDITATGIAYKLIAATDYTDIACGTSFSLSASLTALASGSYTCRPYVERTDGERVYGSDVTFYIGIKSNGSDVYRTGWAELPVSVADDTYHYAYHMRADNASVRNFSVCYSSKYKQPVWVAAPMHNCYKGSSGRTNSYKADPDISSSFQNGKTTGYTRGHMLGSSDRTVSAATNRQVFYYSNIAAQMSSGFNTGGGAWNNLESLTDAQWCADTLYLVNGCLFEAYTDKYGKTVSPKTASGSIGTIQVPTAFYKVMLRTKKGSTGKAVTSCTADELKCVVFILGHYSNASHKPSSQDMMSVSDLEAITGFTYFPNVPNAPKSSFTASDWGL